MQIWILPVKIWLKDIKKGGHLNARIFVFSSIVKSDAVVF